jgi:hypothetical protein
MNSRAVFYKNTWLFPGSYAKDLYDVGDFQKLDKHLKEVEQRYKELLERKY